MMKERFAKLLLGEDSEAAINRSSSRALRVARPQEEMLESTCGAKSKASPSITGEIPEEIATLDGLLNLNLSKNHFSGNVPSKIGAMQSLESLDLSGNKLSGEIPASLSTLTFLSYLDLSYNNLTGAIPSGSQLDTLYAEHPYMYNGNIGLCGPPLKNNCLKTNASEQGPITRTDEEGRWQGFFYIGLGYGFLAGIWLVSCALLFMKNWRIAYFRHFDKLYDKAYVLLVTWWAKADQEDLQRS